MPLGVEPHSRSAGHSGPSNKDPVHRHVCMHWDWNGSAEQMCVLWSRSAVLRTHLEGYS